MWSCCLSEFVYKAEIKACHQTDDIVVLNLYVPENLYYFQGHFDVAAVLPGVVQTDWVMQYLAEFFQQDLLAFSSLSNLKFQQIVGPGYQLTLELKKISEQKFGFSYYSEHGQHASGKVIF